MTSPSHRLSTSTIAAPSEYQEMQILTHCRRYIALVAHSLYRLMFDFRHRCRKLYYRQLIHCTGADGHHFSRVKGGRNTSPVMAY